MTAWRPEWLDTPIPSPDSEVERAARARQDSLTKPRGSLGRLETLAVRMAGLQGTVRPALEHSRIVVFAADHGVAADGVSAYPRSVTAEMLRNFARGGAAINVLARGIGAELEVVDVGVAANPGPLAGVRAQRVAPGTANLRALPAMTEDQVRQALEVGREAAVRAAEDGVDLLIGGEMGIGNTTAASALACALLGRPAEELVGPGTGIDAERLRRKTAIVGDALALHGQALVDPGEALRCLGGLEIAALTGAYAAAAQRRMPVLVDGFVATVAALAAARLRPGLDAWLIFAHRSAEPGHRAVLDALDAEPILDLGMRLGEGSGAAAAVPLMELALALHCEMATFEEAGVGRG